MSEIKESQTGFVGYEYLEVSVSSAMASMYLDGYESFGWQEKEHFKTDKTIGNVELQLRRNQKISNKAELTRLQRNFEASMEEIRQLERSKTSKPQIAALSAGIIGTLFMAGSTFAVTAEPPIIWLCVLLALPGFIGWATPYFLYRFFVRKRIEIVTPLIEQKYDEIYELCRKGNELL